MSSRSLTAFGSNMLNLRPGAAVMGLIEGALDPVYENFWNYVRKSPHVKVMTFKPRRPDPAAAFLQPGSDHELSDLLLRPGGGGEVRASLDRERFLAQ